MIQTSLFFTTHNRPEDCIRCLEHLKPQLDDSMELILLDDYYINSDKLIAYCLENGFMYIHTGQQKRGRHAHRMPGYALNIGFKLSLGERIIFGNAEMWARDSTLLSSMIKEIDAGKICSPVIWDQLQENLDQYAIGNNKLPFFWGMPRMLYEQLGGYDEDFTGYCFDDDDFSERARSVAEFTTLDCTSIHLWNIRGVTNRGDSSLNHDSWLYNKNLFEARKGILKRNTNRRWGVL